MQLKQNKMEILKDTKNDLFARREVEVVVEAEKNPGNADSTKFIASKFETEPDNIVITKIKGRFGRKAFHIAANIYDSKEAKEKGEPKPKKKKGEEGEQKPAESAPAAPAPAEEKKEEKPAAEESAKEEKADGKESSKAPKEE